MTSKLKLLLGLEDAPKEDVDPAKLFDEACKGAPTHVVQPEPKWQRDYDYIDLDEDDDFSEFHNPDWPGEDHPDFEPEAFSHDPNDPVDSVVEWVMRIIGFLMMVGLIFGAGGGSCYWLVTNPHFNARLTDTPPQDFAVDRVIMNGPLYTIMQEDGTVWPIRCHQSGVKIVPGVPADQPMFVRLWERSDMRWDRGYSNTTCLKAEIHVHDIYEVETD